MPPLPVDGAVRRRGRVDQGDALVGPQALGGDLAEVRRRAGHVDGLALRSVESGERHRAEPAGHARRGLGEQLAVDARRGELRGGGPHLEQVAGDGVEVVEPVAELDPGVRRTGGEHVQLVGELAAAGRQHDERGRADDLAVGELAGQPLGQARRDARVGGQVEAGEDAAADGVQPGLLVVAADGEHQPAVEHGDAGDLLGGVEDRAAGGVHVAGLLDHHLLGGDAEQVLAVLGQELGRGLASGRCSRSASPPAAGELAEVPGDVVLATHPAGAGARPQLVDDALEAGEPAGDVDVGVRAGVRRGRDQRLRTGLVTPEGAVAVAGGERERQRDGDGEGKDMHGSRRGYGWRLMIGDSHPFDPFRHRAIGEMIFRGPAHANSLHPPHAESTEVDQCPVPPAPRRTRR